MTKDLFKIAIYLFFSVCAFVGCQRQEGEALTHPKDALSEEKPNAADRETLKELEELIEKLKHKDIKTRCDAAKALGGLGDTRAVEPLIEALKDESYYEVNRHAIIPMKAIHFRVTRFAAEALGKIGDRRAVKPLIKVLKDDSWSVRMSTMLALGDIGDPAAIDPLLQAAKNQHGARFIYDDRAVLSLVKIGKPGVPALIVALKRSDVAGFAVRALGRIKDPRAVIPLTEHLDTGLGRYAAQALGAIGDLRAVEPLIKALGNSHARDAAAWALGDLGDKRAVPPLLKLFNEDKVFSPGIMLALGKLKAEPAVESLIAALKREEWQIHNPAASALGYLGDKRAVGPLIDSLKRKEFTSRISAAVALGKIGEPAVKPLIEALDDKGSNIYRHYVINALGRTKSKLAVEPLLKMLEEEDNYIRSAVVGALAMPGDEKVLQPLIEVLRKDPAWDVRSTAAWALGELGDERATSPLIDALKDMFTVREKAFGALKKLTKQDFGEDYDKWKAWYEKNKDK